MPGRSSCFASKGKTEDNIFRKVGEQLHVATVLEGSVRKVGDKLPITAQLINVAEGFHLWSQSYRRAGVVPGRILSMPVLHSGLPSQST